MDITTFWSPFLFVSLKKQKQELIIKKRKANGGYYANIVKISKWTVLPAIQPPSGTAATAEAAAGAEVIFTSRVSASDYLARSIFRAAECVPCSELDLISPTRSLAVVRRVFESNCQVTVYIFHSCFEKSCTKKGRLIVRLLNKFARTRAASSRIWVPFLPSRNVTRSPTYSARCAVVMVTLVLVFASSHVTRDTAGKRGRYLIGLWRGDRIPATLRSRRSSSDQRHRRRVARSFACLVWLMYSLHYSKHVLHAASAGQGTTSPIILVFRGVWRMRAETKNYALITVLCKWRECETASYILCIDITPHMTLLAYSMPGKDSTLKSEKEREIKRAETDVFFPCRSITLDACWAGQKEIVKTSNILFLFVCLASKGQKWGARYV